MVRFLKYGLFILIVISNQVYTQTLTETKLLPPILRDGERFGYRVTVINNELLISAEQAYSPVNGTGAVYRYLYNDSIWQYIERMDCPSGVKGASFGYSVAVDNSMLIIGAPKDTSGGLGWPKGAVYVYNRTDTSWILSQRLEPNTDYGAPRFGSSVAFNDSLLIIGALYDFGEEIMSGAAYVYKKQDEAWVEIKRIVGQGAHQYSEFGTSVAIYNNFLFIGAPQLNDSGSVYIYRIENDSIYSYNKLIGSQFSEYSRFGNSLSLSDTIFAVGAPGGYGSPVTYKGSVYIFLKNNEMFTEYSIIVPRDSTTSSFGSSIWMKDDSLLVGSFGGQGKGFLYTQVYDEWIEKYKFTASDGSQYDFFGQSCAFDNGAFVFGAPLKGIAGAVYIYQDISVGGIAEDNINKFEYNLSQNYPNPFNPKTKIKYNLPIEGYVVLKVYNTLGEEVTTIVNEQKPAGFYEVEFNASDLSSGMYIYKLLAGNYMEVKKMILAK